jgi:serine/threonine protein kinase
MADRPVDKTPEQVGPYRIVEQIGRGGMAVVYLARQPVLAAVSR